jgi:hypothetical protein
MSEIKLLLFGIDGACPDFLERGLKPASVPCYDPFTAVTMCADVSNAMVPSA